MNGIIQREAVSGNIFIREMLFPKAGMVIGGHHHHFDHTTYCPAGAVLLEVMENDQPVSAVELRAGQGDNWFLIEAEKSHRITALEDGTVTHCIYSHRGPNGMVVQVPNHPSAKAYR